MESKFLRVSIKNVANGLIVAVGSAVVMTIQAWLTNPNFDFMAFDWNDAKVLGSVALSAGLAYIAKKFFSDPNSDGLLGKI
jgi:hypothetical protein